MDRSRKCFLCHIYVVSNKYVLSLQYIPKLIKANYAKKRTKQHSCLSSLVKEIHGIFYLAFFSRYNQCVGL